ncbi:hypothetical protein KBC40_03780 [Patescibacteria group bacterium]|nr:hypothetical protein [Patescibacteria group bacterium]
MAEENSHDFKSLAENPEGDFTESAPSFGTPKWQWALLIVLILAVVLVLLGYFFKDKISFWQKTPPAEVSQNLQENNELELEVPEEIVQISSSTFSFWQVIDSDKDSLSDEDELNVWLSDPSNPDTDGDSYSDGQEVSGGYDPTSTSTLDLSLYTMATPQRTLDTLAQAFNENNLSLWLDVLSEDNLEREILEIAGQKNLDFMRKYYQSKRVKFFIKNKTDLSEDMVQLQVEAWLDLVFFERTDMILLKENKNWKILE